MSKLSKTKNELVTELEELKREHELLTSKHQQLNTTHKQLVAALLESEERFHKTFHYCPQAMTISTIKDGRILEANKEYLRLVERTYEEVIGQTARELLTWPHPEQRELIISKLSEVGQINNVDVDLISKSGKIYHMLMSAAAITIDDEPCTIISGEDITERKYIEDEMRINKARLELALSASGQGLWDWDIPSDTTFLSDEYYKLTGYTAGQVIPNLAFFKSIMHPDDYPVVEKAMSEHIAGMTEYSVIEYRMTTKQGILKWIKGIGKVVEWDADGNPLRMMGIISDISEQKNIEAALRLSEERMRVGLKAANIAVFNQDLNLRYTWICQPQLGYTYEEVIGCTDAELLPPEAAKHVKELKQRVLDTGRKEHAEISVASDGVTAIYDFVAEPIVNEHGEIIGLTGASHDITKFKYAEEQVRKSESEFRMLAESMPQIVWITRPDGWNTYFNQRWIDFTGLSLEESYGEGWIKPFHPEDKQKAWEAWQNAIQNGTVYSLECRLRGKDGVYVWWLIRGVPVHDERGKVVKWFGTCTDINESKRVETELRQSEEKWRSLFAILPVGVSVLDENHNLFEFNSALEKILDLTGKDLLDKRFQRRTYIHTDKTIMLPEEYASTRALREQKNIEHVEMGIVKENGETIWTDVSAALLPFRDGTAVVVTTDITERKLVETELKKSKDQLEQLYKRLNQIREEERAFISREIHDELGQLLTALKMELNRIRDEVNVSPDSKNRLLGALKLVNELIKKTQKLSSDLRPGILDDLGLIPAIEWYSQEFQKRTSIVCCLELEEVGITQSEISLALFRILQEALTNIIRHANAKKATIHLYSSSDQLCLVISDNGVGIDEEKIHAKESLGLNGVRERLKQFNGNLQVISVKNKGTQLTISIPASYKEQ